MFSVNMSAGLVTVFTYISIIILYCSSIQLLEIIHENIRLSLDVEDSESNYNYLSTLTKFNMCFLTLWVFILQIIFLSIAVFDELSKLLSFPSALQKLLGKTRAFIFSSLVFPSSALVVFTFWSIWAVDRELVFPKIMDTFFPMWLNHVLHTFILIPLAIEVLLPKKDNFITFKTGAPVILLYAGIYQALYFSIYFRHGVWLYPIYKEFNAVQMVLFNLVMVVVILGFLYLGISLQNTKKRKIEGEKKKIK